MLRIATIGTSPITENFIEALGANDRAIFAGAQSRDAERAHAFAQEHGGKHGYSSVEELAADPSIDAVYIGSPNACHAPQALALISAGKHVLVEKSFCSNRREAQEVFDAAERANVVALEAMRPLHDPAYYQFKDALEQIGRIRRATIRFGKYSSRYDDILAHRHTNIFDCNMASGGLMDMGVYSVEPMVDLLGAPEAIAFAPILIDAQAEDITHGPIDAAGTIMCTYPGAVATLHYSKFTQDFSPVQIEGERGTITLDSISMPSHMRIDMMGVAVRMAARTCASSGSTKEIDLPKTDNSMCYELADFIDAVEQTQAGTPTFEATCGAHGTVAHFRDLTLATMDVMDQARAQAGIVFPADRTGTQA